MRGLPRNNPCYHCYFAPDGSYCHLAVPEISESHGCKFYMSSAFTHELRSTDEEVYYQLLQAHKNARNLLGSD